MLISTVYFLINVSENCGCTRFVITITKLVLRKLRNKYIYFWLAPLNKDIDKIGETANVGLDSSVGRAPGTSIRKSQVRVPL